MIEPSLLEVFVDIVIDFEKWGRFYEPIKYCFLPSMVTFPILAKYFVSRD